MKAINWKLKVGDRIIDHQKDSSIKRDLTIIDRKTVAKKHKTEKSSKGYVINNRKYYKYKCNICGYEGWIIEDSLCGKKKCGCACCTHVVIVKGINDVATTHPHLIPYFSNKEDAYLYSVHSNFKPELVCPICGHIKNNTSIYNLTKNGFSCLACSDGVSYGEKFINAFLQQTGVNFVAQLSKRDYAWCKKYRYDFWFKYKGEEYIIEVHGIQHYKEQSMPNISLTDILKNDEEKKETAAKNGFDSQHYIVIDCQKSEFEWIKKSIYNSVLSTLFNLSKTQWDICHANATKSLVVDVAQYWEQNKQKNLSTTTLAKIFGLNSTTIVKYLKIGTELGLCQYNAREELNKNLRKAQHSNQKAIVFLNNKMELVALFSSQKEAAETATDILKEKNPLNSKCISRACCNKNNHWYRGYYIITFEEYKKLKGE